MTLIRIMYTHVIVILSNPSVNPAQEITGFAIVFRLVPCIIGIFEFLIYDITLIFPPILY